MMPTFSFARDRWGGERGVSGSVTGAARCVFSPFSSFCTSCVYAGKEGILHAQGGNCVRREATVVDCRVEGNTVSEVWDMVVVVEV